MRTYVVLLRGINVGGRNKVPMADLRACLQGEPEIAEARTLIASGNVVVRTSLGGAALQERVEALLPTRFTLDADLIRVHVLTSAKFRAIVDDKPDGFGERPDAFHSDAIFLMGISVSEAMAVFTPREGIDAVWPGTGVVYSQRLNAQRTKSRLGKIVGTPQYASMTIRSWRTTERIVELLDEVEDPSGSVADR